MKKRSLPLSRVYSLLETGPVVLISTSADGKDNIMTQSGQRREVMAAVPAGREGVKIHREFK